MTTQIDRLLLLHCHKYGTFLPDDIEEWIPFVCKYHNDEFSYKKHPYVLQIINDISNEELEISIKLNNEGFLKNCLFFNAILIASCANDYEILIAIINKGININTLSNNIQKSGLEHAVRIFFNNDNFPVIKLLIENGANIHIPFSDGDNFFHTFIFNSMRINIIEYLRRIRKNIPDFTLIDFDERIYYQYIKNYINIYEIHEYVLYILIKGGDYRIKNNQGYSAKYYLENTSLEQECLWHIRKDFLILYEGCSNIGLAEKPLSDLNYIKELLSNM
jgi:ankyrin repeat protein